MRVGAGDFQECGDTRSIVERTMADGVSIDWRACAQMIHMRRIDDILIAQHWIRAHHRADDVRALVPGLRAYRVDLRLPREQDGLVPPRARCGDGLLKAHRRASE